MAGITLAEDESELQSRRAMVRVVGRRGHSSDEAFDRRGICGICVSRGTRFRSGRIRIRYGGQWQNKGYELIDELKLVENARRIGEEAVALHQADQCPEGKFDIILDSSQLGLQIHESVGHPIELDRVLGMEANFAGTSFLDFGQVAHAALRQRSGECGRGCAAGAWSGAGNVWI